MRRLVPTQKTNRCTFFCYKRAAYYEATHTKQFWACKGYWEKAFVLFKQLVHLHIAVFLVCSHVKWIKTTSGSLNIDSGTDLLGELYPLIEGELINPKYMKQYQETNSFQLTGCVLASRQHYARGFKCWGVPGLVVAVNITVLKVVMNSDCGLRVVSMGRGCGGGVLTSLFHQPSYYHTHKYQRTARNQKTDAGRNLHTLLPLTK